MKLLKRAYRSLEMRLYLVLLLLVIPINCFTVILSQQVVQDYQDKLERSYQHELDIFFAQTDSQLESLQNTILTYSSSRWSAVFGAFTGDTSLKTNQFFSEMNAFCSANSFVDCAYLLQGSTGRKLVIYDSAAQTREEMLAVRADLEDAALAEGYGFSYPVITLGGAAYWAVNFSYRGSAYGFLIRMDRLLEDMLDRTDGVRLAAVLMEEDGEMAYASDPQLAAGDGKWAETALLSASLPSGQRFGIVVDGLYSSASLPLYYYFVMLLSVFSLAAIPLIWLLIRREVTRPVHLMEEALRQIGSDNLDYRITQRATTDQFQYLFDSCNNMARDLRELTIENYEKELARLNLERNSLLLQVSPHMLLNSLSMIYSLSLSRNDAAIQSFTRNLMQYFRYVLRENREFVTLEEELRFVESYLEIQKIRYPGRFTYVYKMEDELKQITILPFLIENFIENAVKYGLTPDRPIEIILNIRLDGDRLLISVVDTGNGMDRERVEALNSGEVIEDKAGRHIGIWNCRQRIRMYFGETADLHFSSEPGGGTQVWMDLPYQKLEENRRLAGLKEGAV